MWSIFWSLLGGGKLIGLATAVLNFLRSGPGVALLIAFSLWYAHHAGRVSEREVCQAGIAAAENVELKRRLEATRKVAEESFVQLKEEETAVDRLQEKVAKYERDLEDHGGGKCPLTADDITRLRQ